MGVVFTTITVATVMPYKILLCCWIHKIISLEDGKFVFITVTGN